MVHFTPFLTLAITAGLITQSTAHPGEHHDTLSVQQEIAKRTTHANHIARGLNNCAGNEKYHALQARASERRLQKAQSLRRKRELPVDAPFKARRDLTVLETFETTNHNLTGSGFSTSSDAASLFATYKNVSCILTPEVTYGPYYVSGEFIRSDVVDGQEGIPVHLEYQYIDVSTCEPVSGLYVDTWQANATGVYSGVVASGNGNEADTANLNNTALRGMQPTDTSGVAAFDTLFVGHYDGRASHIHLIAHHGGTVLSNGTYAGGNISHVGQLFFPEDLKAVVEATFPYNTNTQAITTNDEDMWAPDQADNSYDPFPEYAYLGDGIEDGMLMWISVGVDLSEDYTVEIAAAYGADGGVAATGNSLGSGTGGGNGTGAGNMTMPSGGNGTAPTGIAMNGTAPSATMNGTASIGSTSTSIAVIGTGGSTSITATSSKTSSALAASSPSNTAVYSNSGTSASSSFPSSSSSSSKPSAPTNSVPFESQDPSIRSSSHSPLSSLQPEQPEPSHSGPLHPGSPGPLPPSSLRPSGPSAPSGVSKSDGPGPAASRPAKHSKPSPSFLSKARHGAVLHRRYGGVE